MLSLLAIVTTLTFGMRALTAKDDLPIAPTDKFTGGGISPVAAGELEWLDIEGSEPHEDHDVAISGRALNEDGQPVVGARVFVVPVIPVGVPYDPLKVLAEGTTDAEGRYRFPKVKLSVLKFAPSAVPQPSQALFQVFGIADGYGYVWRHTATYRPKKDQHENPGAPTLGPLNEDVPQPMFVADEPIVIDLKFSPEVKLQGTIRDNLGKPLRDAIVQVGSIASNRSLPGTPPNGGVGRYLEETPREVDARFDGYFALPEKYRQSRTDSAGRYEIRGIPRDCRLLAHVDYLPEFDPWTGVILTDKDDSETGKSHCRAVGYAGQLDHVLIVPVTVHVKVLGTDQRPLANVIVRHESKTGINRAGALERTDASGMASLKVRPGDSQLFVEPTIGQPYLPRQQALDLKPDPRQISLDVALESAAEVIFEAVEKETGKPIPDVAFLSESDDKRERQEVQSQVSFVDHPRTDRAGRMRAFFAPGKRRFFVNHRHIPVDFEPVAPTTEAIHLAAAKPTHLRFEFTRRPIVAATGSATKPIATELQSLAALLRQQETRFKRSQKLRIQLAETNYLSSKEKRPQRQMTELLNSFTSKTIQESLTALGLTAVAPTVMITDGTRRRVETNTGNPDHFNLDVFNGEETITAMGGEQLNVYGPNNVSFQSTDLTNLWLRPDPSEMLGTAAEPVGDEQPRRTVQHAQGVWTIENTYSIGSIRWVIDDSNGFLRQMSS
ncbi:MAG: hypothetical protein V4719_18805, partial [Planctomycetota bacterium]